MSIVLKVIPYVFGNNTISVTLKKLNLVNEAQICLAISYNLIRELRIIVSRYHPLEALAHTDSVFPPAIGSIVTLLGSRYD